METCSRAPSCDHFGCNGKWKLYLATKILKKVASWWPTDQLKKVRFEKIFGSKSGGGGGRVYGVSKNFLWQIFFQLKVTERQLFEKMNLEPCAVSTAFAPYQVCPYLIPCSPPHFLSSTPSSQVHPLVEWYPDELICKLMSKFFSLNFINKAKQVQV